MARPHISTKEWENMKKTMKAEIVEEIQEKGDNGGKKKNHEYTEYLKNTPATSLPGFGVVVPTETSLWDVLYGKEKNNLTPHQRGEARKQAKTAYSRYERERKSRISHAATGEYGDVRAQVDAARQQRIDAAVSRPQRGSYSFPSSPPAVMGRLEDRWATLTGEPLVGEPSQEDIDAAEALTLDERSDLYAAQVRDFAGRRKANIQNALGYIQNTMESMEDSSLLKSGASKENLYAWRAAKAEGNRVEADAYKQLISREILAQRLKTAETEAGIAKANKNIAEYEREKKIAELNTPGLSSAAIDFLTDIEQSGVGYPPELTPASSVRTYTRNDFEIPEGQTGLIALETMGRGSDLSKLGVPQYEKYDPMYDRLKAKTPDKIDLTADLYGVKRTRGFRPALTGDSSDMVLSTDSGRPRATIMRRSGADLTVHKPTGMTPTVQRYGPPDVSRPVLTTPGDLAIGTSQLRRYSHHDHEYADDDEGRLNKITDRLVAKGHKPVNVRSGRISALAIDGLDDDEARINRMLGGLVKKGHKVQLARPAMQYPGRQERYYASAYPPRPQPQPRPSFGIGKPNFGGLGRPSFAALPVAKGINLNIKNPKPTKLPKPRFEGMLQRPKASWKGSKPKFEHGKPRFDTGVIIPKFNTTSKKHNFGQTSKKPNFGHLVSKRQFGGNLAGNRLKGSLPIRNRVGSSVKVSVPQISPSIKSGKVNMTGNLGGLNLAGLQGISSNLLRVAGSKAVKRDPKRKRFKRVTPIVGGANLCTTKMINVALGNSGCMKPKLPKVNLRNIKGVK